MCEKLKNKDITGERVLNFLWIAIIVLILLNIIDYLCGKPFWQITRLIHLEEEGNFTTWFSSIILATGAVYSYNCAQILPLNKEARQLWEILAAGLMFMSCDEVAQIHENLGNTINKYLIGSRSIEHSAWVIILGPIILLVFFVFAWKIKKHLKGSFEAIKYLLIGMLIYVTGAFLLEAITNVLNHENLELIWKIEIILEGSLELIGAVFITQGIIKHYSFLLKK